MIKKSCKNCSTSFNISDEDLEFYKKVSPKINKETYEIPPPTLCPDCRQQRRMTWRNEHNLYQRNCDSCKKNMISIYDKNTEFPVYCHKCWWSDDWDRMEYGKDYDFNRPFFEQFKELRLKVPRINLSQDENSVNSDYTNHGGDNKNCYLAFLCIESEDLYNSKHCYKCKDSSDCFRADMSELCYECTSCQVCWNLHYSQNCNNCKDSLFLVDCRNCDHCIGCTNLRNKSYHIFNKKVAKEEFEEMKNKFKNYKFLENFKKEFKDFEIKNTIFNFNSNIQCEDLEECDYGQNSKNCYKCFDIINCQDLKYTSLAAFLTDSYDVYSTGGGSLVYELVGAGDLKSHMSNIYFSFSIAAKYNIFYCDFVDFADNLFGCIGLKHKKYCILNKQYTKEEFEKLVPQIIEHMKKTGEWGEFFPMTLSLFPYNKTAAFEYYPMSKEKALEKGLKWEDADPKEYKKQDIELPENIDDISDNVVGKLLSCTDCGKNYKIVQQELKLYKKLGVHIPRHCPDCRYEARFELRNPRKIWNRKCDQCHQEIKTTFSPERPEKVYCEDCYLKEIV